jgi:UDP-2,3-diacylglucosamine hydrolase
MPHSLFISDLHLSPDTQPASDALFGFLDRVAPGADNLFVLGDLFEYWIGDEALDHPFSRQVAAAFRELAAKNVAVKFMHGNRDFLVGERFAAASGMQLLPDPLLIDLYGKATLLMHGDSLCTEDTEYQKFRSMVRDPAWQKAFLARPVPERMRIAQDARGKSEHAKQAKDMAIMDVTPGAVDEALRRFGYPRLIHGHTHRPARHLHAVDGRSCERWVLSDWYARGSYLVCDAAGCRAEPID